MSAKSEYTNQDRWRHIKHFVDTHPYSESNLEYLEAWIKRFTVPPKELHTVSPNEGYNSNSLPRTKNDIEVTKTANGYKAVIGSLILTDTNLFDLWDAINEHYEYLVLKYEC